MFNYKVHICGVNTSQLIVLKEKEKIDLINKMNAGDKGARELIISGNLRLVLSVVQKFTSRGENLDDLFQIGCIGLIKSIDNFNTSLNVRFSTYAVPMIIGEIKRYLRDNSSIRVSRSMRDIAYKAMQAKERFIREHGREPKIEEIAEMIDVTKQQIVISLEAILEPSSLFDPVYNDSGDTIYVMDQVADKITAGQWTNNIILKDSIDELGDREKNILSLRFLKGLTQTQVAAMVGISQAQVSRIEKNAVKTIRDRIYQN